MSEFFGEVGKDGNSDHSAGHSAGAQQFHGLVSASDEGTSRIVTARGTENGLVFRIDGKSEWSDIRRELETFLGERRRFFEGGEVLIEWLDRLPTKEQTKELETLLRESYGIEVGGKKKRMRIVGGRTPTTAREETAPEARPSSTIPLYDLVEESKLAAFYPPSGETTPEDLSASLRVEGSPTRQETFALENEYTESAFRGSSGEALGDIARKQLSRAARALGEDFILDEDPNAKVVFGTLRSGQRIETPFSLIVIGDVNPGADLIAGGHIIILGSLRGTAHAAAYDEDSHDRVIIALQMQPMQLRIGSVISRGSDEAGKGPEIAHIEDRRIVVETYNSRVLASKRIR